MVGSTNTGAGSDISLSGVPGLEVNGKAVMGTPASATTSGAVGGLAQDAKFTLDGMAITSPTNKLDKTLSGLSMTLTGTGDSQVSIGANTDGLKASIQKFVDAYNAVANAISSLTKPSLDDDGNPTIPAALDRRRHAAFDPGSHAWPVGGNR